MTNYAVTGAQWGDEGKGKVVDLLAGHFDYVVRFQGGHNAGHSVVFRGERFGLHVMPSGIFNPNTVNLVANGVVVEPFALIKEIEGLRARGVTVSPRNFKISDRAHIIMPYHGILDRFRDQHLGSRKIGTTGRGIGPAYEWKAARRGFRFCDVRHGDYFRQLLSEDLQTIHQRYGDIPDLAGLTVNGLVDQMQGALDFLAPHVVDGVGLLARARGEKRVLLFEGAQATLLDVDFGTYPFVTSSNSCVTGLSSGAGVPPSAVDRVVGICKAYQTRVGEGPFPTELEDQVGDRIRQAGAEYGTTTGRPRRCGWLDLVALRYAHQINGYHCLALMKLDILDEFEEVQICRSYRLDGREIDYFPASVVDLDKLVPVYHRLAGWQMPTSHIRRFRDLPQAAQAFIQYVEDFVGCPIGLVSVGPDREQPIIRGDGYLPVSPDQFLQEQKT